MRRLNLPDVLRVPRLLVGQASRHTLLLVVLTFALILAMAASVSARWDRALRQAVVPMDSLVQSRKAFREAARLAEEAHSWRSPGERDVVFAKLDRALFFARELARGQGTLAGLGGQPSPPSEGLRQSISEYVELLEVAVSQTHERALGSGVLAPMPRVTMARLDRAAGRVEARLQQELRAARHAQLHRDLLSVLLVAFTGLVVIGLRYRSERGRLTSDRALARSEARLRAFASALPDVALMLDENGTYLEVFGDAARYLAGPGLRRPGTTVFEVFPVAEAKAYLSVIQQALAEQAEQHYEYSRQLPDGTHWFEARVCPIADSRQVSWLSWDVTQRHVAEARVRQLTRLYDLQSQVNHAIVMERDVPGLARRLCTLAIRAGGFGGAWVVWADGDGLRPLCSAGGASGSCPEPDFSVAPFDALLQRWRSRNRAEVLALAEYTGCDWAHCLQAAGYASAVAIPLRQQGVLAGCAVFVLGEGADVDGEQHDLFDEIGKDLSHALDQFALRDTLREQDARVRLHAKAMEGIRDAVVICGTDFTIQSVNRGFERITGYLEADVCGRSLELLDASEQAGGFFTALGQAMQTRGYWQGEVQCRRANGERYPQLTSVSVVPVEPGLPGGYVVTGTDLSALHQLRERLTELSFRDPLTGMPNRTLIATRLEHALESARRDGSGLAVLFIDLDQFKQFNDGLGHHIGDAVLKAVSKRLQGHFSREDTLGRYGGDEFVLIVPQLPRGENAGAVAQAVQHLLEQPFVLDEEHEVFVKCSIGISLFPEDGRAAVELIERADAAMHQAKLAGRNCFRFYTQAYTQIANERLELERRLRRAVREELLQIHYQPLVSLEDGHLIGAEALVRLDDGLEPRLGPAQFIPTMEESGLIVELGAWVQREVCRQGRAWLDEGRRFDFLALNLSAQEVQRVDVRTQLAGILERTGMPPDRLELEITESGLMGQGDRVVEYLRGLRDLGLRLAIDDFGTGYSSLAYLKRFPVSKLKIDRSFISDIPTDLNDMQLTTTIISLARNLGLRVLAEGVETVEQRDFLQAHGCQSMQGYLVSPPLPAAEFAQRFMPLDSNMSPVGKSGA